MIWLILILTLYMIGFSITFAYTLSHNKWLYDNGFSVIALAVGILLWFIVWTIATIILIVLNRKKNTSYENRKKEAKTNEEDIWEPSLPRSKR